MEDQLKSYIKSQISDPNVSVNPAEVWSNVERKLDKKRKNRFLFWIPGLLILGVLISIYLVDIPASKNNDSIISSHIIDDLSKHPQKQKNAQNEIDNQEKNPELNKEIIIDETSKDQIELIKEIKEKPAIENSRLQILSKDKGEINKELKNAKVLTSDLKSEPSISKPKIEKELSIPVLADAKPKKILLERDTREKYAREKVDIDFSEKLFASTLVYERQIISGILFLNVNEFYKQKSRFFIEVNAGVYGINKNLVAREIEFENYVEDKKITETPLEAFSSSIHFGIQFPNNISIKTGLNYQSINEKFEFHGSYDITEQRDVIDTIFVNGPDDFDYTYNTEIATHEVYRDIIHYNRYQLFSIPLILAYESNISRFTLDIEGGMLYNFKLDASGIVVDLDGIPTNFNEEEFKSKNSLQWMGALNFGYNLSKNIRFDLKPTIYYYPNSFMSDQSSFDTSYTLFGINGSLRFYLN